MSVEELPLYFQACLVVIIISSVQVRLRPKVDFFMRRTKLWANRPFPSSKKSHFQNEAKCETFVVKMSFICIIIKNHFHINSFALSLTFKVRFFGTRKWPIKFMKRSTSVSVKF